MVEENKYIELPIYELYYANIQEPKWYDILSYNILKYLPDNWLTNKLLYYLDKIKFGDGANREKLVELMPIMNNTLVKGCSGDNHITEFLRTKPFDVYEIKTENCYKLKCADTHMVCAWNLFDVDNKEDSEISWKPVCELNNNYLIMTEMGWSPVVYVKNLLYKSYMADISILEDEHDYFSNGLLSHNTTTVSCYFAWALTFHDNKSAFVSANKKDTGEEIISKIKIVLEGMPFFMKPGILSISARKMKFENGSSIKTSAASKTPATGDSILLLYIDEAAVIAPNIIDEYWASVYPTLSSFAGHQIILSSTPRGKGNLFYEKYTNGIPWNDPRAYLPENEKKFITSRVDWWEVPGRGPEWEAELRADLGDEKFNREFGLSFESSSTRLINAWYINFMKYIKCEYKTVGFYNIPESISSKIVWHPNFHPDLMTYQDLITNLFLFVIDTAQGIEAGVAGKEDADYNVINIFRIGLLSPYKIEENRHREKTIDIRDVVYYELVGVYMDNFKDEKECAEAAKYLAFHVFKSGYGEIDNVRILVEMNFNGNNWLNTFKSHPSYYEQIIIKTPNGQNQQGPNIKYMLGYKTTTGERGKTYYCELGEKMLRKRQIIVSLTSINPDTSSTYQLENFGKTKKGIYKGTACHDDLSITCLFVCIAGEQLYFRYWLQEWLERLPPTNKVQVIRNMLELYVETETEISDEQFTNFYNMASAGFGKLSNKVTNTYSNIGQLNNNYNNYNNFNNYHYLNNMYKQRQNNIASMSRFLK